MMVLSFFSFNNIILTALIGVALFFDLTRKRIPNFLTFPAIVWGLISYTGMQGFSGLWFSFLGLLVGLAIFFIPFAMGGMGGGDVKLLGAVGALQGWQFVLSTALLAAIAGGVMAFAYLIFTGRLLKTLIKITGFFLAPLFDSIYEKFHLELFNRYANFFYSKTTEEEKPLRMPYGVAIATGVLILLLMDIFQCGEAFLGRLPW